MKKILFITAAVWMLAGCNSNNTKNTGACSNYDNQTLCSQATYASSGCFWNSSKTCAPATDCGQPTTQSACEASSQAGTQCTWDGSACFLKASASSKCSDFASKDNCQGTWAGDGYCSWNATTNTCSTAVACSDIQDQAVCSGAMVASKTCKWTPGPSACQPNNPSECTLNSGAIGINNWACCAGKDFNCSSTDASCNAPDNGRSSTCRAKTDFTCTLNGTNQCCVGIGCTGSNPNCTFAATAGSCGDA